MSHKGVYYVIVNKFIGHIDVEEMSQSVAFFYQIESSFEHLSEILGRISEMRFTIDMCT
jgi:hypothetical protein